MQMKTLLKLEDGILLKEYSLPWREDGFNAPPAGWIPGDLSDILVMAAQTLEKILESQDFAALTKPVQQKARREARQTVEQMHYNRREMWRGWLPIVYQTDRKIGKAYRRLFVSLNGGQCPPARDGIGTKFPLDGMYEFKNNRMVPLENEGEK